MLLRGGNLQEARPLIEDALARREAVSRDRPEVADSLTDLGLLLFQSGERDKSRALHERALAIREAALGKDHPDVADSLVHLGLSYLTAGDYATARAMQERSLAIREAAFGPNHPLVAINLEHLGKIAHDLGALEQARAHWERCLRIRLETLGPDHPQVGNSLTNLGSLLSDMGDYNEARGYFERAIEIKTKAFGPEHVQVASTVNNLATLLWRIDDPEGAIAMHERALGIYEKALGPDHRLVGQVVNNIALIEFERERYPQAREHYERALKILEAAHPDGHPDVASVLGNLALVLTAQKETAAAEAAYTRGLAMSRKVLGDRHASVGNLLDGLATLDESTGNLLRASERHKESLAIFEEALGPDHPGTASERFRLARAERWLGNSEEAFGGAIAAERALLEHFRRTARGLAEREALAYEGDRLVGLGLALSILTSGRAPATWVTTAFDEVVKSRAVVLDEMASRRRAWLETNDPATEALGGELSAARNRLARLVTGGGADPAAMARAVEEREKAERRLADRSALYRLGVTRARIGLAEVRAALPAGGALVSFVQYDLHEAAKSKTSVPPPPVRSYAALIVPVDKLDPLRFVALGPADLLDRTILEWRDQVAAQPAGLSVPNSPAETRYRETAQRLRKALWDPVAPVLKDAARVFLVPDGDINLVDFGTLPDGDGYLIEKGPILHYLSAERDLVARPAADRPGKGILAVGGADFEARGDISAASTRPQTAARGGYRAAAAGSGCEDLEAIRFDPLPGTAEEISSIVNLWPAGEPIQVLTGSHASEAALKSAGPGHRVLHIATHSFFLHDLCPSMLQNALEERPAAPGVGRSLLGRNPLLLTGLALAGANHPRPGGTARAGGASSKEEDGLLTAEEIGAIDLEGVEWAVLSACETGVGRIQAGEGVLGLRRAFQVAGVRSLIMSLWRVQDDAARQWMTALYAARFGGRGTSDAVRRAGLVRLRDLRQRGRSTHPFFWGGFVAIGDWR